MKQPTTLQIAIGRNSGVINEELKKIETWLSHSLNKEDHTAQEKKDLEHDLRAVRHIKKAIKDLYVMESFYSNPQYNIPIKTE